MCRPPSTPSVPSALGWVAAGADDPWQAVRLALGSVAGRPIRAGATEAWLEGRLPSLDTADTASVRVVAEIEPINDVRSTADYRRALTARVLHRMIRDAGGW